MVSTTCHSQLNAPADWIGLPEYPGNSTQETNIYRKAILKTLGAAVLLASVTAGTQTSASGLANRNHGGVGPHINAPLPFNRQAVSINGNGDTASGGCQWTREQIRHNGKLVWRPLLQCYYGW